MLTPSPFLFRTIASDHPLSSFMLPLKGRPKAFFVRSPPTFPGISPPTPFADSPPEFLFPLCIPTSFPPHVLSPFPSLIKPFCAISARFSHVCSCSSLSTIPCSGLPPETSPWKDLTPPIASTGPPGRRLCDPFLGPSETIRKSSCALARSPYRKISFISLTSFS